MRDTRVLLLSDGRPGHFRLSEGVIAAIQRSRPVETKRLELRNRWHMPKAFIPKISRRLPPSVCLRLVYGLDPAPITKPDLIVSAGGLTLGANTALASVLGAPNIYCGSTRNFPLERFSLILTDDPRKRGPANLRVCPKPSAFDPDTLPPPRPLATEMGSLRIGILVGGPIPAAAFDPGDWHNLAGLVQSLARDIGAKVIVVTGPRTPEEAHLHLKKAAARHTDLVTLIDFRSAGPGSSTKALAADIVLVTSDSMSMLTEAALSRRPAIGLRPTRTAPTRDDFSIASLVEQNWLAMCELATASPQTILDSARALSPMRTNHLDQLAAEVLPLLREPTASWP
jgi:uncharacterized protein